MIDHQPAAIRPPAGLLRRLGAIVSDSLVVVGLLLLGSLLFVPLLSYLDAKAFVPSEVGWFWSGIYWVWLLTIWMVFFGFFWSRSGQTVGMRAWRIRVESESGAILTWSQALKRLWAGVVPWFPCLLVLMLAEHYQSPGIKYLGLTLSLLGVIGWLVLYIDPHNRTWGDRISRTRVILLPKP